MKTTAPILLIMMVSLAGCGASNSENDSTEALSCNGILPGRHTIRMTDVLPDFNSPFRVELSTGEVYDPCDDDNDDDDRPTFQISRNLRNLVVAKNYQDVSNLPTDFGIKVTHLGSCSTLADDMVRLEVMNQAIQWQELKESNPKCKINRSIFRADTNIP